MTPGVEVRVSCLLGVKFNVKEVEVRLGAKHGADWHGLARIPCYSRIRANPCQSALPFFVIFLDIYTMGSPMHVKGTCRSLNFIGVLTELYWRHKIWKY